MWAAEDFHAPTPKRFAVDDFWSLPILHTTKPTEPATASLADAPQSSWVWDMPAAEARPEAVKADSGVAYTRIIDRFIPRAFENPFIIVQRRARREGIAAKRARWLISLLDVPESRRRRGYTRFFENLFIEFPHHNTYRALANLAVHQDLSAEMMVEACRFRLTFLERHEWWACRSYGQTVAFDQDGARLLSWTEALRLTQICGGDPSRLIHDEWLDEWLALPPFDRDRLRFLDYARSRLMLFAAGVWDQPEADCRRDASREWRRLHGLPGASDFARTAELINLKSIHEEYRPA